MSGRMPFVKMHGAGNDFLMVAAANLPPGGLAPARIAALCDRRRGVGADGLIVLGPADGFDFGMTYHNADGGEAEMCGNGARCAVAFARRLGLATGESCRFRTAAGPAAARWVGEEVAVDLPPWRDLHRDLAVAGSPYPRHHLVNTGVPHLVVPVPDPAAVDLARWGPFLRRHEALGPAGANVDWVAAEPRAGGHALRTYERGVEDETLACGTGAAAAAVVLCDLGLAASPVVMSTRGGDRLTITVEDAGERRRLELRGPAAEAFTGEVELT